MLGRLPDGPREHPESAERSHTLSGSGRPSRRKRLAADRRGPGSEPPLRRGRGGRRRARRRHRRLPAGRFAAIMGPSGSGKSTLMHMLAGLDRPTSGTVRLGGVELTALDDRALTQLRRDKIGFIFQTFNLLPVLSAEENILLPLSIAGREPDREWFDAADRHGRHPRPAHTPPRRALRRPAAARRRRARARLAPERRVRRRALRQPRLESLRRRARAAAPGRRRLRPDRRDGHPRRARRLVSPTGCSCSPTGGSSTTGRRSRAEQALDLMKSVG